MFKPGNILISLFFYLTNVSKAFVIIKNKTNTAIYILIQKRLKRLVRFNYNKCFIINTNKSLNIIKIAVKKLLLLKAAELLYNVHPIKDNFINIKTVYRSGVTIYSDGFTVKIIKRILNKFFKLL